MDDINKWIAIQFASMLQFMHGIVLLLLIGRVAFSLFDRQTQIEILYEFGIPWLIFIVTENILAAAMQSFVALITYIIFAGILSTFVGIFMELVKMNNRHGD